MSVPLIPDATAKKADTALSRFDLEHRERVAKAKAVDAALNDINRGKARVAGTATRSSSCIESILIIDNNAPAQKVEAKKAAPVDLHPRVKSLKTDLSPDAAQLLSLVIKADEAYRGARLLDLTGFAIAQALNIREKGALEARAELERAGLIVFRDDGSGNRGFVPRLP